MAKIDSRVKKLKEDGGKLFSERGSLHSLWQEIAWNFYVEMADFTIDRYLGDEWADHLTTSYPLLLRRSLGDALSSLLRPVNLDNASPGVWFNVGVHRDDKVDNEGKRWLEFATKVMRDVMYDRKSGFVRAAKEGDHLFATFGQAPISVRLSKNRDRMNYRTWHLRDVAWAEDSEGEIDRVYRKWKPTATQLVDDFGDKVSPKVKEKLEKEPYTKINCMHIMIKTEKYTERDAGGTKFRQPWVSIWIDEDNDFVMEEVGSWSKVYVIPRWVTIPGTQYASSPAVTVALPDARLMQSMTLTLLESGEKFADPPIVGTMEAIRSDVNVQAGGFTWVDAEYDERQGQALRPLYEPRAASGVSVGLELNGQVAESLSRAFFLDTLSLPPAGVREMTAFEVGQRVSEWIRRAMPIFEPMEFEYNGGLCEETFDVLMREGAFGPYQDIPQSIRGQDVQMRFESPLHEGAGRNKGTKFLEAKAALIEAAELDPNAIALLDPVGAMRDVMDGMGIPAKWQRSQEQVDQIMRQNAEKQQEAEMLEGAMAGGETAKNLGAAAQSFASASGQA